MVPTLVPSIAGTTIPLTAWEQGVIVVLFSIIFMGSLGYVLGWMSKQQKAWTDFMNSQNEQWRKWLESQNKLTSTSMDKVVESLDKLSSKIDVHDDQAKEIKTKVEATFDVVTRRRPKAGG
jgi:hypothetical protein